MRRELNQCTQNPDEIGLKVCSVVAASIATSISPTSTSFASSTIFDDGEFILDESLQLSSSSDSSSSSSMTFSRRDTPGGPVPGDPDLGRLEDFAFFSDEVFIPDGIQTSTPSEFAAFVMQNRHWGCVARKNANEGYFFTPAAEDTVGIKFEQCELGA
jgi:hypothetical protein